MANRLITVWLKFVRGNVSKMELNIGSSPPLLDETSQQPWLRNAREHYLTNFSCNAQPIILIWEEAEVYSRRFDRALSYKLVKVTPHNLIVWEQRQKLTSELTLNVRGQQQLKKKVIFKLSHHEARLCNLIWINSLAIQAPNGKEELEHYDRID